MESDQVMDVYQQPDSEVIKIIRDTCIIAENNNIIDELKPYWNRVIIELNNMLAIAKKREGNDIPQV